MQPVIYTVGPECPDHQLVVACLLHQIADAAFDADLAETVTFEDGPESTFEWLQRRVDLLSEIVTTDCRIQVYISGSLGPVGIALPAIPVELRAPPVINRQEDRAPQPAPVPPRPTGRPKHLKIPQVSGQFGVPKKTVREWLAGSPGVMRLKSNKHNGWAIITNYDLYDWLVIYRPDLLAKWWAACGNR